MRRALSAIAILFVICTPPGFAQEEPEPAWELTRNVELVRFRHQGRTVLGTLVSKNAATLVVRELHGDRRTYAMNSVTDLETLELTRSRFLELQADRMYNEISDDPEDAANELLLIRRLYRRATIGLEDHERLDTLKTKLEMVAEDREVLQEELLKREKVRREKLETELVAAEKRLAEKKLQGLEDQKATIERLKEVANELNRRDRELAAFAEKLGEAVEDMNDDLRDLAEDVEDLELRSRRYITRTVVVDLTRDYKDLEDEVDRLKRIIHQLQQNAD